MDKGKIIVLDYMVFLFSAVHARIKDIPTTYTALSMMISCLKKIGVSPLDTIYLATDTRSWRRDYSDEYKANRKEDREKHKDIDWEKTWNDFGNLLERINEGTDWIVLKDTGLEADDFASYIVRKNQDKEVVLVTIDSDWQLLWHYPNVKIFSPKSKPKRYKVKPPKFNAYHLLASKIKSEKADNLTSAIVTEEDYETRMMLVNLIELPEFIDKKIENVFNNLKEKNPDLDRIPFTSLREKIGGLWNDKESIVTYEWSANLEEKRKKRKKKLKMKGVTK
jgi:5'-3' exonuclease